MTLVLDIGNSATKGGFFFEGRCHDTFRLPCTPADDQAIWQAALQEALGKRVVAAISLVSVVPPLTQRLVPLLATLTEAPIHVVSHRQPLPFHLAYTTPATMGVDRLAAAAAAWNAYGAPAQRSVIAADAGTAVTYDVVDARGTFLGGPIGPGPRLLQYGLHRGTAQLPEVPLVLPPTPVGRSTQEALQAGILFGFLDSFAGMLARLADTLDDAPLVIVTGGWAAFLREHLPQHTDHHRPHLVLEGGYVLLEASRATP